MVHLDTHVICWLHDGALGKLSAAAREQIETQPLFISPMIELELQYLNEIGRLQVSARDMLDALRRHYGVSSSHTSFDAVVAQATGIGWTRDPFDRLIVAHAAADNAPLVTCDAHIRKNFSGAIW